MLTVISFIGISIPSFFFGLLLLKFFAVDIQLFPLFGLRDPLLMSTNPFDKIKDMAWHLVLPSIVLGLNSTASFMRYTRSSMLEVIKQDYIRTARAKGLKEKTVIYRHAFRNAVIPIITLLGFWIPGLFSGAVVTETIFALPGLGKISVEATLTRNYPLILGINSMLAVLTLIGALVADLLYAVADPRIRFD
jgi:peptide/nickel transport system permease protein